MISARILQPFVAPQIQELDNISTVDWNLINDLDPDRIRRNHDSESVQEFISAFLGFTFNNTDKITLTHPLAPRLLLLAQVSFDYLIHCNKNFGKVIEQKNNKINKLKKQYKLLKDSYMKAKELIHTLRGSLETCPCCQRRFKSGPYLDQHIRRKHPDLIDSWNSLRTQTPINTNQQDVDKLIAQIKELKEQQEYTQQQLINQQQEQFTRSHTIQNQQQFNINEDFQQNENIENTKSSVKQTKTKPKLTKEQKEINQLFVQNEEPIKTPISPQGPLNPFAVFHTSDVSENTPNESEVDDQTVTKRTQKENIQQIPQNQFNNNENIQQKQPKKVKLDDDNELPEPDFYNVYGFDEELPKAKKQQQQEQKQENIEYDKPKIVENQPKQNNNSQKKKPATNNSAAMKKARQFLNPFYREQQNHMNTSEFEERVRGVSEDIKNQVAAKSLAKLKGKEELSDGEISDDFTFTYEEEIDGEKSDDLDEEFEELQQLSKPPKRPLLTVETNNNQNKSNNTKAQQSPKSPKSPKQQSKKETKTESKPAKTKQKISLDTVSQDESNLQLTGTNPFEINSSTIQQNQVPLKDPFELTYSQETIQTNTTKGDSQQLKEDPFEIESSLMQSTTTQQTNKETSTVSALSSSRKKFAFQNDTVSSKYKKKDSAFHQADESFRESYYHSDNDKEFYEDENPKPQKNLRGAEISSDLFEDSSTFLADKAKLLPPSKKQLSQPQQQQKKKPIRLLNLDDDDLWDDIPTKHNNEDDNQLLPRPAGIQNQANNNNNNKLRGFFTPEDFMDD